MQSRWIESIQKPFSPCFNKGDDNLTFIIMEYIKDGSLTDFLKQSLSLEQLRSLFLQTAFILMQIEYLSWRHQFRKYSYKKEWKKQKQMQYNILQKSYTLPYLGFKVVFIDFGRGNFFHKQSKSTTIAYIIDDILIAYDIFTRYMPKSKMNDAIKLAIQKFSMSKQSS